jgi:hypothetical protein
MIQAIERNKNEVYVAGTKETLALYLKRIFPGLLSKIIRNAAVR